MTFESMCDQLVSGEKLEVYKDLGDHIRVVLRQTKEDVYAVHIFNPYDWDRFKKIEKGAEELFFELRLEMMKVIEEKEKGDADEV